MSSVSNLITKAKNFNADTVAYKPAKVTSRGGKSVAITVNGQPLTLQIPLMLCWGVNERVDENTGVKSYDLALDFRNETSATKQYLENIKKFQDKLYSDCLKNSKEWFGKSKMSKDVVEALMYPMLKYRKNKETGEPDYSANPTLQVKVPFWEGRFNVEIYDMNRKPLYLQPKKGSTANRAHGQTEDSTPTDFIPKASHIKGLIRCSGLWFVGGKCGCSWQLVQVSVRPPTRLVGSGQCMIMDDSDDDEMLEGLKEKEEREEEDEVDSHSPTFDDDEEEEEDEEEEPEPEPEPVKKKKKKVVRRKKSSD